MSDWEVLDNGTRIHKTAIIEPWISLGNNCIVNAFSYLGRVPNSSDALAREPRSNGSTIIGNRCVFGVNSIVYSGVKLGNDCFLGDYASIREDCIIGDKCVIGRQVTINYEVIIGNRSRFQDGTHITGNCVVGNDCFFGVGVITNNDRNVDLTNYHFPMPHPCTFGNRILVGSGACILAGVRVGDDAVIGMGAIVVDNVGQFEKVLGLKARVREKIC